MKNPAAVLRGQGRFCSIACQGAKRTRDTLDPERIAARFWSSVCKTGPTHMALGTECWLWTGCVDAHGYGAMTIGKKVVKAHRVAWFVDHGAWPKLNLLHACDNPPCVRADGHLSEGSQLDNIVDMYTKGRRHTALTRALVQDIRERRALGESYEMVESQTGVSAGTIGNVMCGRLPRYLCSDKG